MNKIIELNDEIKSSIVLKTEESSSLPTLELDGKYQAVIVHADKFDTVEEHEKINTLQERLFEDRLIEARFFNKDEEHRIYRVDFNGEIQFLYRHIKDTVNNGSDDDDYKNSIDTTADFYKEDCTLTIRNYIKKRGLLNSYDDMRFIELKRINL